MGMEEWDPVCQGAAIATGDAGVFSERYRNNY